MDKQTGDILEFPRILKALQGLCFSPEGEELLGRQPFLFDEEELAAQLDRAGEFRMLLEAGEDAPAFDFPGLPFLSRAAREGTVLEGEELAALGRSIRSSRLLAAFLKRIPENRDDFRGILKEQADLLPDLSELEKKIFANLDAAGQVLENHPALRPIRRAMERLGREINNLAYGYLQKDRDIWQAEVPTVRDGRTVLPLKANYRGKIQGIVHEVSGRGATLFIEPMEIVDRNNQLALEENRLRVEIQKILRELTGAVRDKIEECLRLRDQTAYLDTLHARARYASQRSCSRPLLCQRGFKLVQAVHPGLGPAAVPINIEMPPDKCQLIITGPNTGGKTVSLKTLGLFVLMHQFGMEVPAAHGSTLPLVSGVYADVGDEQSIEESLSTFSGHMRRLSFIMEKADEKSLVLLDELGGGTDPHEGAALAMAILDWFASKQSLLVITTHLGVMKNYGYTRPGSLNASVTFDDETLRPTYHILQGIPGESHALEIAAANGMSADLIDTARTYLEGEESDVAAMIRELQETQNSLREQENELKRVRAALEEERRRVDLKALRLKQKEMEIRENQFGDLRGYVRESRKTLENLVSELKSGPVDREQTRRVKQFIAELTEKEDEASRNLDRDQESLEVLLEQEAPPEADTSGDIELKEGREVLVGPHKKSGVLVRKDKKGRWLVAVGTLKMTLSEKELTPVKPRIQKVSVTSSGTGKYAVMELDLRGYRMEEALRLLEKQVDDALMAGMDQFSVIHGLGEGVLQKGVHDYLGRCPAVKNYQFAHPDQGGYGKTEVSLA